MALASFLRLTMEEYNLFARIFSFISHELLWPDNHGRSDMGDRVRKTAATTQLRGAISYPTLSVICSMYGEPQYRNPFSIWSVLSAILVFEVHGASCDAVFSPDSLEPTAAAAHNCAASRTSFRVDMDAWSSAATFPSVASKYCEMQTYSLRMWLIVESKDSTTFPKHATIGHK